MSALFFKHLSYLKTSRKENVYSGLRLTKVYLKGFFNLLQVSRHDRSFLLYFCNIYFYRLNDIKDKRPRIETSLIMLFVMNCVLITLASATANNVSSKPTDNKVSSSLYCV